MTNYKSPISFGNGHIDTLFPFLVRKKKKQNFKRTRLTLADGDFVDLDWVQQNSKKLVILSHGLESCSEAQYILGMADIFKNNNYDVLAWNARGCSGEMNKSPFYYHSGFYQDLEEVIRHSISLGYNDINLIGFSMGGNITLKYLGIMANNLPREVKRACVFSTPTDLAHASKSLSEGLSLIYTKNFLKTLKVKIRAKKEQFPDLAVDIERLNSIQNLLDFDQYFTAPLFKFKDASDYYENASSINDLPYITIPTLIVNAKNDPFLSGDCYPVEKVKNNPNLVLEIPSSGGHCGFFQFSKNNILWSEKRALVFISNEKEQTC